MRVVTVSTDPIEGGERNARRIPGMLTESCAEQGITPIVLGMGQAGEMNRPDIQKHKIHWLRDCMLASNDAELVVFVDAYDVAFIRGADAIMEGFLSYGRPILFSAEKNLFPTEVACRMYPPAPTPWKYLNSGGFCGRASDLRAMLSQPHFSDESLAKFRCDGHAYHYYHLDHPGAIQLDHHCRVFQSFYKGAPLANNNGVMTNTVTGTRPSILHGNGGTAQDVAGIWGRTRP